MIQMKLTKEQQRERDLEYIRNFRLMDDDFMVKVFEDKECTELVLRIILEKPDLDVISVNTEYDVHNLYGHSVRLDVYATDSAGNEYNIEIQRDDRGAGVKRARGNSSMLDANFEKAGKYFDDLPETYVIFITERDVLKGDLPIYHIERVIRETGERFDDKSNIVYVNNEKRDDITPLGRLMHDFACKDANDMNYAALAEKVRYFKEDEKGVDNMCKAMEEMRAEVAAEAKAEGIASSLTNLMTNLKLSFEQAAAALGIPSSERQQYAEMLKR